MGAGQKQKLANVEARRQKQKLANAVDRRRDRRRLTLALAVPSAVVCATDHVKTEHSLIGSNIALRASCVVAQEHSSIVISRTIPL